MRQLSLNNRLFKTQDEFGGSLLKNSNPKTKRTFSTRHAIHVVLRSDIAKGAKSLINFRQEIDRILAKQASGARIKIYRKSICSNHIHLLIYLKARSRTQGKASLSRFLRSISGLIARRVMGAERGQKKGVKFWSYRPYTRIVKGFEQAWDYVVLNHLESLGVLPYRKNRLKRTDYGFT